MEVTAILAGWFTYLILKIFFELKEINKSIKSNKQNK